MYRRPRNRVARDFAERFITRRLVRMLMIEYETSRGWPTVRGAGCWDTNVRCVAATSCGRRVRTANT
jgi:hypothetical protein